MAKLFKGDVNFGFVINQTGAQPLDSRSVVQSYAELLKADTFGTAIYNGMTVATIDEQKVYMLIDKTKSTTDEGWKEVGDGAPSAQTVDTYSAALELAKTEELPIGSLIKVSGDETIEDKKYNAGFYVVSVSSATSPAILYLTTSSGTEVSIESIESDITTLKGTVSDIQDDLTTRKVKDVVDGETSLVGANGTVDLSDYTTSDELTEAIGNIVIPEYAIRKESTAEDGYASTYKLYKGENAVGVAINIPKDMVVSSGEVRTLEDAEISDEHPQGLYIVLTLANATSDKLYIPANKLIDDYTGSTYIDVAETGEISIKYDDLKSALKTDFDEVYEAAGSVQTLSDNIDDKFTTLDTKYVGLDGYVAYSQAEKDKLSGIEEGAQVNVVKSVDTEGALTLGDDGELSINLTEYVKSDDLTTTLGDYVTTGDLTTTLGDYVTTGDLTTTLGDYVTTGDLTTTLGDYVTTGDLTTTLGDYVTTGDLTTTLGDYVKSDDLTNKVLSDYVTTSKFNEEVQNLTDSIDTKLDKDSALSTAEIDEAIAPSVS